MPVLCRCLLIGAVALPLSLPATPASAAAGAEPVAVSVDHSSWSWRRTAPVGLPVDEPSRVPQGGLAVASDGDLEGRPGKATYLHLDLGSLVPGSRVDALTVTVPLDADAESSDSTSVRLVACRLLSPFAAGEGVDPATMPAEDCTGASAGSFDAGAGAWTFGLTALAQGWAADPSSNHGFVVRPPADYLLPADLPFQLSFAGQASVRAELLAEAPVPPVSAPVDRSEAAPPAFTPPPPLAFDAGRFSPLQPPVALPAPVAVAAPAPELAPSALPPVRGIQVLTPPRTSTGALWSLAAVAALLLAGVSRVVGDTAGPHALARRERERLDRLRLRSPVAASEPLTVAVQVPQSRQGRRPMSSATSTVT